MGMIVDKFFIIKTKMKKEFRLRHRDIDSTGRRIENKGLRPLAPSIDKIPAGT
jgi:hypothetical protein